TLEMLIQNCNLPFKARHNIFALSANVAKCLVASNWRNVFIAPNHNKNGLIQILTDFIKSENSDQMR
ncbi:MAG: hypothetical protein AAF403_05905, partial [Pseudomonadota bacterium]